jgi:hypothetical protein
MTVRLQALWEPGKGETELRQPNIGGSLEFSLKIEIEKIHQASLKSFPKPAK